MVTIGDESYLLASEAARHLHVSRVTFYKRYRRALQIFKVGKLQRPHYKLSELNTANRVEPMQVAS